MTESDFKKSINLTYSLYDMLGRSRAFLVPYSLSPNSKFNAIALDAESAYEDIYFCGLRENQLNFILNDMTFFQFSRDSEKETRYAFYPSPFSQKSISLMENYVSDRDAGYIDDEEFSQALESLPRNSRRPALRYEYSDSQYKKVKHPLSHLHIGIYGEDRWSFERFLTPYAFGLQVAKMYFGSDWECLTDGEHGNRNNELDDILISEKAKCAMAPVDKYCEVEKKHFSFR